MSSRGLTMHTRENEYKLARHELFQKISKLINYELSLTFADCLGHITLGSEDMIGDFIEPEIWASLRRRFLD